MLVHSEQATKRKAVSFYKSLDKNITKELKNLSQPTKKPFACTIDAEQAMDEFASQCHLLSFAQVSILKEPIYTTVVALKKGEAHRTLVFYSSYAFYRSRKSRTG
ncbi:hypothetical protein VCO01S_31590 [Vibrio comitans NBRC 102076]|uniref:Uncharacterized protein n=1 Tax=Vibrio comitans NBRC 102076 TaxID=1219078 RepID=A0A4Y3IRJ9_9VIBR|nr:hypothetical protein VCO01S_31590 [Vibrio comitans NBRC 102076]